MSDEPSTVESVATEPAPPPPAVEAAPPAETAEVKVAAGKPAKPPKKPKAPPDTHDGGEGEGESKPEGEAKAEGDPAALAEPSNKRWYVVKVQSGREESIKEAIERRVKIEGLEEFFGQIMIPTEKVVEMVQGKRRTRQRKLFPGYLMVEVEYNDRILYLFRETSGVGDFVGGGINKEPPPMSPREIDRIIKPPGKQGEEKIHVKDKFDRGDRVKVKEGAFAGMEGEIKDILEAKDKVRVELTIFGRPVSVELEYWAVEKT
jgi:transcription termination/antitermination protein NusG